MSIACYTIIVILSEKNHRAYYDNQYTVHDYFFNQNHV